MPSLSRRDLLSQARSASAGLAPAKADPRASGKIYKQLLDDAASLEEQRRERFAAVKSRADLESLQKDLRRKFLDLLDGLPSARGAPRPGAWAASKGGGLDSLASLREVDPAGSVAWATRAAAP